MQECLILDLYLLNVNIMVEPIIIFIFLSTEQLHERFFVIP